MKLCPICKMQYPEDANFCPQETCATADGPQRLLPMAAQPASRFAPIERLGGGHTGEVWKARDSQTGADVAYKIVGADVLPTQASQGRAEREFKQLMRVASPKIAAILDCEKTPTGGLAVAMELCQGDSLDRILSTGPMPFERARPIVSQIGLALLEAQKVGLVHRDVAPKNVLLSPTGDVKVINFPLAKPINDRVAGVPAYLSPEQAQGKPVDQRSNIYSLAGILYHLLAGEPPFQGASIQAVLDMQVSTPLLPPTQRRPGAGLPPDVDKLVLKAMDKSSSRRHLTLRLFLNELEAIKEAPAIADKPGREVGLAKTMMFGGNQADISRMVAEARAAKAAGAPMAAAAAMAPPAASAAPPVAEAALAPAADPALSPTPKPMGVGQTVLAGVMAPHATPPAKAPASPTPATNATILQVAAAPQAPAAAAYQRTPPPVQVAKPAAPVAPAAHAAAKPAEAGKAPPKAGAAFRETLWFKQGDVDQMVADAKAKLQAAGKPPADPAEVGVDARPLEDRYRDDGSVTIEDRKKFSLRTGATSTAMPTAAAHLPGEHIDEKQMVGEISGGRRTLILVIAGVVILALVVVIAMMMKAKGKGSADAPGATTSTLVSRHTAPERHAPGRSPPGQPARVAPPDADVAPDAASGAPPGPTGGGPGGSILGSAGGATQPKRVGGVAGEAKAAQPKKTIVKKKPPVVVKHPAPKHRR